MDTDMSLTGVTALDADGKFVISISQNSILQYSLSARQQNSMGMFSEITVRITALVINLSTAYMCRCKK
jgi:hypothetical protein